MPSTQMRPTFQYGSSPNAPNTPNPQKTNGICMHIIELYIKTPSRSPILQASAGIASRLRQYGVTNIYNAIKSLDTSGT